MGYKAQRDVINILKAGVPACETAKFYIENVTKMGSGAYEKQSYAAPLSELHKNSGSYAIQRDNHHFYPTLITEFPAMDWMGANVLKMWIYAECALYGYFPQYTPAVPSFDCKGHVYILKNGIIQYLSSGGEWLTVDLKKFFLSFFRTMSFDFFFTTRCFMMRPLFVLTKTEAFTLA